MGIKGLYTYIVQQKFRFETVDLVRTAKSQNGIEILVDFGCFVRDLVEFICKKIIEDHNNWYLYYQMEEYGILADAICDFHQHFSNAGVKLVWIMDGPKGLDEKESVQKMTEWISRKKDRVELLNKLLFDCNERKYQTKTFNLVSFLGFQSMTFGLKKANAEIIQLLQGGSDDFIAYEYQRRKSFAIITGDTDFLIFPNTRIIFSRMMDWKSLIADNYKHSWKIFQPPVFFYCTIVSQQEVFNIFQFTEQEQLIALSVLSGNDYTAQYAEQLRHCLSIPQSSSWRDYIPRVAEFVKKTKNIFQLSEMRNFLNFNPEISESVQFSYDFYTLRNVNDISLQSLFVYDPTFNYGSVNNFFREKFSASKICKDLYSIHCGIFQEPLLFEKPSSSCLSICKVMEEIRSKIYPYILDESLDAVTEWQSRNSLNKVKIPVEHSAIKTPAIKRKANEDQETEHEYSIIYGIDIFEEIWSHLEENPLGYLKTFGLHRGFLCYILRYFYKNTINKNLNLKIEEFRALFITVFYQYEMSQRTSINTKLRKSNFLGMRICPTENCLIIFSWFTSIYYTGKYLCGGAFNLSDDFPSPDQAMSASAWFAFYEHAMADRNQRISHLENSVIRSLEQLEEDIMSNYRAEFETVTQ